MLLFRYICSFEPKPNLWHFLKNSQKLGSKIVLWKTTSKFVCHRYFHFINFQRNFSQKKWRSFYEGVTSYEFIRIYYLRYIYFFSNERIENERNFKMFSIKFYSFSFTLCDKLSNKKFLLNYALLYVGFHLCEVSLQFRKKFNFILRNNCI